ncbi:MAG: nuclear transport factor 2 family protein [Bacteroidetes bacterium]|nr:nuclear transport factor 2 family protein [Bacteroidota bacterium]
MNKLLPLILLSIVSCTSNSKQAKMDKTSDDVAIRQVLNNQVVAWNNADIETFMQGYWKSDSILFIGSKITSGWDSTLTRYKKSYPDKAAMGSLRFEILKMDFIAADACLVTGNFFLTREHDNPHGIFTLLFRKKNGNWVIVYDHTS